MRYGEIITDEINSLTLKHIHDLKLQKERQETEKNQKLPFLKCMYGQPQDEKDQQQTDRDKQKQKQQNKEHVSKLAQRQIKNQRKRRQERQDDVVRYLDKQEHERAKRIRALAKKFDQIRDD